MTVCMCVSLIGGDRAAPSSVLIERPDGLWEEAPLEPPYVTPRAAVASSCWKHGKQAMIWVIWAPGHPSWFSTAGCARAV